MRSIDSQNTLNAMKTKNIPLKRPLSVSTLPNPYVYYLSAGILAIYEAHNPINNAMQSNNM